MSKYLDELCRAMNWLGQQPDSIFIGQGVADGGTFMYKTFENISSDKKIEYPVAEQFQMGASIGWAIGGYTCISVYPRHNFLLLGLSELVNLLDNMPEITQSDYMPKVIIRTAQGTLNPIYPGVQHAGHFTEAFRKLLRNVEIIELTKSEDIFPAYEHAYYKNGATLITEFGDLYYS